MRSQNHPIILFLDRNGFSVFQDVLSNIPRFNFTSDIVTNLDVVNKEQFANLISTFIQINKIISSSVAVILSDDVIYAKNLINSLPKPSVSSQVLQNSTPSLNNINNEHKEEIQNFLENVPFEEILAKVIKTGEGSRIVAVNKDLIMTIADVFTNKGATIDAVIPSFLYGPNVNFALGLTQDNIQIILGGSEIFRAGNLLTDQQEVTSLEGSKEEQKYPSAGTKSNLAVGTKKPQNLRQYILIGVFVTLLVVLAVVYLNLGASQTP